MKVPYLDLKAQYEPIRGEIADAIQQVLDKTAFAGGPFVADPKLARSVGANGIVRGAESALKLVAKAAARQGQSRQGTAS